MLALLANGKVKASQYVIKRSLQGVWKDKHVFELRQSFDLYHFYRAKIKECDQHIEVLLQQKLSSPQNALANNYVKNNKNNLSFNAKPILEQITGTDLTEIFGINDVQPSKYLVKQPSA